MSNEHVAPVMQDAEPRTEFVTGDLGLTEEAQTKDVHCQSPSRQAKSVLTATEEPVRSSTGRCRGRRGRCRGRRGRCRGGRGPTTTSAASTTAAGAGTNLATVAVSETGAVVTVTEGSRRAIAENCAAGVVAIAAAGVIVRLSVGGADKTYNQSGKQGKRNEARQNPLTLADKCSLDLLNHGALQ